VRQEFEGPRQVHLQGLIPEPFLTQNLETIGRLSLTADNRAYSITFIVDPGISKPDGYKLVIEPSGTIVTGTNSCGLFYGIQTFLQLLTIFRTHRQWYALSITDWPAYKKRGMMVDMGRSVFTLPMLRRIVRILARLKLNQLHLHLYDDELCGIWFEGLPLGLENPYSISIDDLAELIKYAEQYHIEIIPELEGWGHVGSIVYHYPALRGGKGMYEGSSFLVGNDTLALMTNMIEQVVRIMPRTSTIHLGLDEANWYLDSRMAQDFSPSDLVFRYFSILQSLGEKYGKEITLRVWADHAGRPIPESIQSKVIIEPWDYWNAHRDEIDRKIRHYAGQSGMRWMMAAGQSGAHFRGAYRATRYWCTKALGIPNLEGVNITFWLTNDLRAKMISLFTGAYYAWNPLANTELATIEDEEEFDRKVFPVMYNWQSNFRDAFPDDIEHDRGPLVVNGYYLWGPKHAQPVAPTAPLANTREGHDYLNE